MSFLFFFSLKTENLWQIPEGRKFSESSHLSEEIPAPVTGRVPGVWGGHPGPAGPHGGTAGLPGPGGGHQPARGLHQVSGSRQGVHGDFQVKCSKEKVLSRKMHFLRRCILRNFVILSPLSALPPVPRAHPIGVTCRHWNASVSADSSSSRGGALHRTALRKGPSQRQPCWEMTDSAGISGLGGPSLFFF